MIPSRIVDLSGTQWAGTGELWVDPEGNNVEACASTLSIGGGELRYTWSYQGAPQEGRLTFEDGGASWRDTWHQKSSVQCSDVLGAWGVFTVRYTYGVPTGKPWGWRIKLSERPNGDLVLQMVNIAPWGEEARAVRMVVSPA